MNLRFIDDYINDKLIKDENYVRITYYDLRVKHNLTENETQQFLELVKNKLNNMGYLVYFTDEKYRYKNANMTVQANELLIAIKEEKEVIKNERKTK